MNNFKERGMQIVFALIASMSILAVITICFFLFLNGLPAIFEIGPKNFLLGTNWKPTNTQQQLEILPMILGSIYITIGAIIIGVPLGVLSAIFMAKSCPKNLYNIIKPLIELLAGIPSVVFGFFGMLVIVPFVSSTFGGNGYSILSASILLGIMILPTIITITESSIKSVPKYFYEGALALGASHERSIFAVVIPACKSGIIAAIILGIGRAIGETMAVVMVAGNQARMPKGVLKGARTMTSNIVLEMGYAADLHRESLIATGVVLFTFILLINLGFALLKRRLISE